MPAGPGTSATPEQAFAQMCGSKLPDSVINIECHGAFWMDHSFSIRFNASDADIEQILKAGYTTTGWNAIKQVIGDPPYLNDFEGRWLPSDIVNKSCYTLANESSDYYQQHFLVIDHETNLVYCVSSGSAK